ncbi:MAG: lipopolysaccharide assembly protein LapB [Moraxellaceae bacterium]|nr:MAG: lipopolysaccharide assembly protein LapB [Moraxellaceae bacterium]
MKELLIATLLFLAIVIGWFLGKAERKKKPTHFGADPITREYFLGLNLLLDDKQDEAMEVFMRTLEVNSDTVDTYLVMGGLFRRRGEVDRAIRIHQDLLARPSISKMQQATVRYELARDYLKAGLLDRSERILKELVLEDSQYLKRSLELLLSIYEKEKSWGKAVTTGTQLIGKGQSSIANRLAHYHCEMVEQSISGGDVVDARKHLKKALQMDKNCVRASLLQGQLEFDAGKYKDAIRSLRNIRHQDDDFSPEALPLLDQSYQALGQEKEYIKYLFTLLERHPAISIVIALSDKLRAIEGDVEGAYVLSEYLKQRPSVRGLHRLIDFHIANTEGPAKENLALLQAFTQQMIHNKPIYQCNACGFDGKSLHWHCPTCLEWGTVKPIHGVEGE